MTWKKVDKYAPRNETDLYVHIQETVDVDKSQDHDNDEEQTQKM